MTYKVFDLVIVLSTKMFRNILIDGGLRQNSSCPVNIKKANRSFDLS